VYLIRHGETDHNVNRIFQGNGEVPLNDAGIAQAARLAERLASMRLDVIVSSDLRRAVMTAAILAARTGAHVRYDTDFRERNPGALAGRSYDEGEGFFLDYHFQPPEGENVADFSSRVKHAFTALAERYGGGDSHVALVTHGMVCAAFGHLFLDHEAPLETVANWRNASLTVLDYEDGAWRLVALGDDSHLEEAGDSPPPRGAGA